MRKYPVGMVLGGRYYWGDGTLNHQGTYGNYWSSSAYTSATSAYDLSFNGTNSAVNPAFVNNKRRGFSLRCLAQ